jgi:hypothetical protein
VRRLLHVRLPTHSEPHTLVKQGSGPCTANTKSAPCDSPKRHHIFSKRGSHSPPADTENPQPQRCVNRLCTPHVHSPHRVFSQTCLLSSAEPAPIQKNFSRIERQLCGQSCQYFRSVDGQLPDPYATFIALSAWRYLCAIVWLQ